MVKEDQIKKWVKEAIEKGYSSKEVIEILKSGGYEGKEIKRIVAIYKTLKDIPKLGFKKNEEFNVEIEKKEEKYALSFPKKEVAKREDKKEEIPKEKALPIVEEKKIFENKTKSDQLSKQIREIHYLITQVKNEIGKAVVGQEDVLDAFLCALLCDGHVLLEGVPGVAKTLIVKALAEASGCSSKRVQFTIDLLPSDIVGVTTYTPGKGFETIKGPIFANFIVADEINRSPSKTQSALIEAMQ